MKKIRVMTVFGTRPETIKMAPLVKELQSREEIETIVCVTAQHREMLDQVLNAFSITPRYDLNIMQPGQTLSPDYRQGPFRSRIGDKGGGARYRPRPRDTTTTFAGALAAYYSQVKIGHVEAGLRTGNKYSPYPEEMNRQMVGVMATCISLPLKKAGTISCGRESAPRTLSSPAIPPSTR